MMLKYAFIQTYWAYQKHVFGMTDNRKTHTRHYNSMPSGTSAPEITSKARKE